MSAFDDLQQSNSRLRQRADDADRRATRQAQEDVVIEYPRRLFLRAPGGDYFALSVTDAGTITATNIGNQLP